MTPEEQTETPAPPLTAPTSTDAGPTEGAPPVNNDHVEDGAEPFTQAVIEANSPLTGIAGANEAIEAAASGPEDDGILAEAESMAKAIIASTEKAEVAVVAEAKKVWNNALQAWV